MNILFCVQFGMFDYLAATIPTLLGNEYIFIF